MIKCILKIILRGSRHVHRDSRSDHAGPLVRRQPPHGRSYHHHNRGTTNRQRLLPPRRK